MIHGPEATPRVRLTLEHMQHSIEYAMTEHFAAMDEAVREAVRQAVDEYNYGAEVKRLTHQVITATIKQALLKQFIEGGPVYKALNDAALKLVEGALEEMADG